MKQFEVRLMLVAILLLTSIGSAMAQTSKGFVVGIVEDQNGASIPNAAVKITNLTTGVVRETVADSSGSFRLDAVDPGAYGLTLQQRDLKLLKSIESKLMLRKLSMFPYDSKSEVLLKKLSSARQLQSGSTVVSPLRG